MPLSAVNRHICVKIGMILKKLNNDNGDVIFCNGQKNHELLWHNGFPWPCRIAAGKRRTRTHDQWSHGSFLFEKKTVSVGDVSSLWLLLFLCVYISSHALSVILPCPTVSYFCIYTWLLPSHTHTHCKIIGVDRFFCTGFFVPHIYVLPAPLTQPYWLLGAVVDIGSAILPIVWGVA